VNTVLHTEAVELMKQLPGNSIPLIIVDPPYGIGYHSNHYKDKNPHAPVANDWNFEIGTFLMQCARVLKDGGALYLFCRWDVSPLWIPYIQASGLKLKTIIAWVKDNWSAGDLDGCFGNQYEQILFITKGRHLLRGKRWPNVWNFPRVPAKQLLHPTQKPVQLIERAILASSDVHDAVLDCFMGSGTTGEACMHTERNYLLCDIDTRMVAIASKRLGLPIPEGEQQVIEIPSMSIPEVPCPEEWGIHPEDLLAIYDAIRGNVKTVYATRSLWEVA